MTQKTYILVGSLIVLALGVLGFLAYGPSNRNTTNTTTATSSEPITRYFGNRIDVDLNGDGQKDAAFIVTQTGAGSGTFYYLAHTLGGEAVFLGDRIAPQTTEWRNGQVVVNYADRRLDEPMTAKPSVGVTRYFKAEGNTLVEVKKAATPTQGAVDSTLLTTGEKCARRGGTWSAEFKECTGVDKAACTAIGGTFNECASPCRNDPKAEACIMMCVQVCTFK
jgi:hypothetical protein